MRAKESGGSSGATRPSHSRWLNIGGQTNDDVPFLAPEIVLLYKAKQRRPHDELELAAALPTLSDRQRTWLRGAIEEVHPGHPWLTLFDERDGEASPATPRRSQRSSP
jgi:hypothetical protein